MKRLVIDIETSPNLGYVWRLFRENLSLSQLVSQTEMLCFAAKWIDSDEVMFASQWDHGRNGMVKIAWELLDQADAVVGWNSRRFDTKHMNREFLEAKMAPPSPYKHIDLLETTKSQFAFTSNKLDNVAQMLGVGRKLDTGGFELWRDVMQDDPDARQLMEDYNVHDVEITEAVYHELVPWITNHPNWALYVDTDRPVCQNCGSEHVIKKGLGYTTTFAYQRYRCGDCGHNMRGRTNVMTKEQRDNILVREVS